MVGIVIQIPRKLMITCELARLFVNLRALEDDSRAEIDMDAFVKSLKMICSPCEI